MYKLKYMTQKAFITASLPTLDMYFHLLIMIIVIIIVIIITIISLLFRVRQNYGNQGLMERCKFNSLSGINLTKGQICSLIC